MDQEDYPQSSNQFKNKLAKSKLQREQDTLRDFTKKVHEIEGKQKSAIKKSSQDCETDSENDQCCSSSICGTDCAEGENISGSSQSVHHCPRILKSTLTQEQQKIELKALEKQVNSIRLGSETHDHENDNTFYAEKQRQKYLAKTYGTEKKSKANIYTDKERNSGGKEGSTTNEENKSNEHKPWLNMKTKEQLEEEKRQAYEAQIMSDEKKLKEAIDPKKDDDDESDTDCDDCSYDYEYQYEYDYEDDIDKLIESSDKDEENITNN